MDYSCTIRMPFAAHPVIDQRRHDEESVAELRRRGAHKGAEARAVDRREQPGADARACNVDGNTLTSTWQMPSFGAE